VKKEVFSNNLLFILGKRTWHPRIFTKITKLSLQQVGKTSWQIGIHIMPSDGGLGIFAKWRGNFAKLTKLPSSFANLLETVFYGFGKNPKMLNTFSKLLELPKSFISHSNPVSILAAAKLCFHVRTPPPISIPLSKSFVSLA